MADRVAPEFDFAPLMALAPNEVIQGPKDHVGRLMLLFAAVYNDLKGANTVLHHIKELRKRFSTPDDHAEAVSGHLAGSEVQAVRLISGIVREFIFALRKMHGDTSVLDSAEFLSLLDHLPDEYQEHWSRLLAIVEASKHKKKRAKPVPPEDRQLWEVLERVRNAHAFHYNYEKLAEGYASHFGGKTPVAGVRKERAFFCAGSNMDQTRFFFADAASSAAFDAEFKGRSRLVNELALRMNTSIKTLVHSFLFRRGVPLEWQPVAAP